MSKDIEEIKPFWSQTKQYITLDEVKISIIEEENPSKIKQLVGNT